jgi:hypothetical protein
MSVYPPPNYTEALPIFNTINWETYADAGITTAYLEAHYLQYPVAQGLETLNGLINLGDTTLSDDTSPQLLLTNTTAPITSTTLTNTSVVQGGTNRTWASIISNTPNPISPSPAGTYTTPSSVVVNQYGQITSATNGTTYTLPSPLPTAGSYTNANITINSAGQITSASNGTGGITSFTITSNAVGTNSWTFTIPNSYGRAYNYSLYTDTTPTTTNRSNVAKPITGVLSVNGSFLYATGSGILESYSTTSATSITYCGGFQQNYTITASGSGYAMSIVNSMGATLTWSYSTNSVNDNGACPPTANAQFTTSYTLTSSTAVASCYVKLVGIVIAS